MRKRTRTFGMPKGRIRVYCAALAAGGLLAVLPPAAHADGLPAPTPAVPTDQGILQGNGTLCATDEAAPATVADPTPQLLGRVHVDPASTGTPFLRADFTVESLGQDGTWSPAGSELRPSDPGFTGDNQLVSVSLTTELAENTLYRLTVATWSYTSDYTQYTASADTTPCYFTVDPTAPLPPKVTFGGPYTECTANDCAAHGGAGVPGTFTFAPGDGDSPVVTYQYKLSSDSAWSAPIPGSPVTVTLTPPLSGTEQLQVRAEDTAARWGRTTSTSFRVA